MSRAATAPKKISASAVDAAVPLTALDLNLMFRRHRQHILRFVQRYVRNAEDAEDVVQNAFVEALRCVDRFSGLSKPSTWLFGIALNLARNQVRRNCNSLHDSPDESFFEQIIDSQADPATVAEMRQVARRVEALLEELPEEIRATFEVVLDGGATYEEAAKQLNIPIGTVRSRVSRVRAAVRAQCGNK